MGVAVVGSQDCAVTLVLAFFEEDLKSHIGESKPGDMC